MDNTLSVLAWNRFLESHSALHFRRYPILLSVTVRAARNMESNIVSLHGKLHTLLRNGRVLSSSTALECVGSPFTQFDLNGEAFSTVRRSASIYSQRSSLFALSRLAIHAIRLQPDPTVIAASRHQSMAIHALLLNVAENNSELLKGPTQQIESCNHPHSNFYCSSLFR